MRAVVQEVDCAVHVAIAHLGKAGSFFLPRVSEDSTAVRISGLQNIFFAGLAHHEA